MKKTILKNMRRAFPFFNMFIPIIMFKTNTYSIVKNVMFTDSAIYHFDDDDQYDVNKLFGFALGIQFNNSIRFGWRPNKELNKIEIVGYEYVDKVRVPTIPLMEVNLNQYYEYEIKYNGMFNQIEYNISDGVNKTTLIHPITLKNKVILGYRLGLYFGGNKVAPHDIVIYINN